MRGYLVRMEGWDGMTAKCNVCVHVCGWLRWAERWWGRTVMCDVGFEMLCYFILGSHSRIYIVT